LYKTSVRLEYLFTYNQAEYEAFIVWFEKIDRHMGVKDISTFGDSFLVVQQFKGKFRALMDH
jgi:ribonuclease HI